MTLRTGRERIESMFCARALGCMGDDAASSEWQRFLDERESIELSLDTPIRWRPIPNDLSTEFTQGQRVVLLLVDGEAVTATYARPGRPYCWVNEKRGTTWVTSSATHWAPLLTPPDSKGGQ